MDNKKKYTVLFLIALVVAACAFALFFFYHMGATDARAIAGFPVAYHSYDQAVSAYSRAVLESNPGGAPNPDDLERKADEALAALDTQASVRISSLTKNDGDLMKASGEIAALAGKEIAALKAYRSASASQGANLEVLAQQLRDLASQRQAAYARYLQLAGLKN